MKMFSLIATIKKLGQQSSLLLLSKCTKSLIKNGVNDFLFQPFWIFLTLAVVIFVLINIFDVISAKSCCITGLLDKDVSSFVHFLSTHLLIH